MINIILFSGADLIFVIKFNLSSKCKVCKQRLFLIQKFLFVRRKYVSCFSVNFALLKITAGPSIPPAVSYTKGLRLTAWKVNRKRVGTKMWLINLAAQQLDQKVK